MARAKALFDVLPALVAALLARGSACCFEPGEQGGTYHGNALMTAAGLAVLDTVLEPGFLERVREVGDYLHDGLLRLAQQHSLGAPRGHGLLLGLPLHDHLAARAVRAAHAEGLLINAPQADCLRFSPALTVTHACIDEMLVRLQCALLRANCDTGEET